MNAKYVITENYKKTFREENLWDLGQVRTVLAVKVQSIKGKIDQLDLIKI